MNGPIVVGYDGSDQSRDAVALAAALAAPLKSPLLLAWVEPVGPLDLPHEVVFASIQDRAEDALEEVAQDLRKQDLEVTTRLGLLGSVAHGIQELAEDASAALIIVGSSHRGRVGRVLAGTVGTRLLHGSPCPVAIAPRGYDRRPVSLKRFAVGYDGTPESELALKQARFLAHTARATMTVIAVAEAAWPADARDWLQQAIDELRGEFTVVTKMAVGEPGPELVAISQQFDLLVVGSHGYGPVRRALAGSVASHLIERCRCPLIVTPRGTRVSGDAGTAAARPASARR
jgi:nucleotide-binding universal stress UspA family protein